MYSINYFFLLFSFFLSLSRIRCVTLLPHLLLSACLYTRWTTGIRINQVFPSFTVERDPENYWFSVFVDIKSTTRFEATPVSTWHRVRPELMSLTVTNSTIFISKRTFCAEREKKKNKNLSPPDIKSVMINNEKNIGNLLNRFEWKVESKWIFFWKNNYDHFDS